MSVADVETGLEKLAGHGSILQIRDHLLDHGITGTRKAPAACAIANYLRAEGFASVYERIQVVPNLKDKDAGKVHVTSLTSTTVVPLPRILNQFGRLFDQGGLPELVERPGL